MAYRGTHLHARGGRGGISGITSACEVLLEGELLICEEWALALKEVALGLFAIQFVHIRAHALFRCLFLRHHCHLGLSRPSEVRVLFTSSVSLSLSLFFSLSLCLPKLVRLVDF